MGLTYLYCEMITTVISATIHFVSIKRKEGKEKEKKNSLLVLRTLRILLFKKKLFNYLAALSLSWGRQDRRCK